MPDSKILTWLKNSQAKTYTVIREIKMSSYSEKNLEFLYLYRLASLKEILRLLRRSLLNSKM